MTVKTSSSQCNWWRIFFRSSGTCLPPDWIVGNFSLRLKVRSRVQKFLAWPTFYGDGNKTTLLFFNIVSIYFNALFNWYINLIIDGTIYPSQHFPFGAAFVCQAGNFWVLLISNSLTNTKSFKVLTKATVATSSTSV